MKNHFSFYYILPFLQLYNNNNAIQTVSFEALKCEFKKIVGFKNNIDLTRIFIFKSLIYCLRCLKDNVRVGQNVAC